TAERYFRTALASYAELDELNSNVMMARIELAMALAFQGDLAAAVPQCEEARATCEEYGERWAKAYALYVLSFAAWAGGRSEAAFERGGALGLEEVVALALGHAKEPMRAH